MDNQIFSNSWIKWAVFTSFTALSLFLLVKVGTDLKTFNRAGDEIPSNTITVTGTGEVFASPDVASFSFSIVENANTVAEAQKVATDKNNKAIEFLKSKGIDPKDIQTTDYNVNPRYEYKPCTSTSCPSSSLPVGFTVSQTTSVKVRDISIAGDLLSGVGKIGASNLSGLSFKIDDDQVLKGEAREKAIANAKTKAQILAKQLGVSLGKVTNYNEDNAPIPMMYSSKAESFGMGGAAPMVSPQVEVGQNKITVNVSVTYKIN
ncbi:MAG: SIMPL domain-containing protein [Candidatus Paceibacterota bacterium]